MLRSMTAARHAGTPGRMLSAGRRLGRYVVLDRVGHGGMGELYVARDEASPEGRILALKVLLPHLAHDPELVRMFLNEARYAALLSHPNIAAVHDMGLVDGEHFIAMELVDGPDLRVLMHRVAREGGLPLDVALSILVPIAAALHYAHERCDDHGRPLGLVHRDVSPSNLVIGGDGVPKLVDFGLAKALRESIVTKTGVLKGKLGYMAPEQLAGSPVDRRTDIFGMGVLLFECTTGRRLFVGDNEFAVMNQIARGQVPRPSTLVAGYLPGLEDIVLRALATDPGARYATAEALRCALVELCREQRIVLSTARVAALLAGLELAGPAPELEAVTVPRIVGTEVAKVPVPAPMIVTEVRPEAVPIRPRGWWGARLAGAGVATLGIGLLVGLGLRGQSPSTIREPPDEPPPAVIAPSAAAADGTEAVQASAEEASTGEASAEEASAEETGAVQASAVQASAAEGTGDDESVEVEPEPSSVEVKRRRRRPTRRPAAGSDRPRPAADPLESLLPVGGR
jgi:hypothetical protein